MNCRGCGSLLKTTFLDLGCTPIANDLLEINQIKKVYKKYPLHAMTCSKCALVQLSEVIPKENIFTSEYVYFSSYSSTWLEHSKLYVQKMISFLQLKPDDLVVEVASNDGYLLQFFSLANIQTLGIEPASSVASVAITKGIPTVVDYFCETLAIKLAETIKPRLIIGNNVLAHVPDLHDFIKGFSILIKDNNVITFEFPHLLNLVKNNQFDTIYHEHYSYLNVFSLIPIFNEYKLKVFKIEKLSTHGGSLRIYVAKHDSDWAIDKSVQSTIDEELEYDPRNEIVYRSLQNNVEKIKKDLLALLKSCKSSNQIIAAYGAAAKGITLLNYFGINSDLIDYVIDISPIKQGLYIPGINVPIVSEKVLNTSPPDVLLVLPWNLSEEIKLQLSKYVESGLKIVRAIPKVEYF